MSTRKVGGQSEMTALRAKAEERRRRFVKRRGLSGVNQRLAGT
jgi:hypothetical protein